MTVRLEMLNLILRKLEMFYILKKTKTNFPELTEEEHKEIREFFKVNNKDSVEILKELMAKEIDKDNISNV